MSDDRKEAEEKMAKAIFISGDGWLAVFDLLKPSQLGLEIALISHRFDYYVDEHFKTRKWALGIIRTGSKIGENGTKEMEIANCHGKALPIPQIQMPRKVTGFERIRILFIDRNVIAFLRRFRPLFASSPINLLIFTNCHRILELIMHNFWPMTAKNICGMFLFANVFHRLRQSVPSILNDCPSLRVLSYFDDIFAEFPANAIASDGQAVAKWLFTPHPSKMPKVCKCEFKKPLWTWSSKIAAFKANFADASSPSNFIVVILFPSHFADSVVPFDLTNKLTREQLALKTTDYRNCFLLVRCPIARDESKWTKWEKEAIDWQIYYQWNKIDIEIIDEDEIGHGLINATPGLTQENLGKELTDQSVRADLIAERQTLCKTISLLEKYNGKWEAIFLRVKGQALQDEEQNYRDFKPEGKAFMHWVDQARGLVDTIEGALGLSELGDAIPQPNQPAQVVQQAPVVHQRHDVTLPPITLPKFSGEPREWSLFWKLFETSVESLQIEDFKKHIYLLGCLPEKSIARRAIDLYPPSDENYPRVVEILKKRFGDEKTMVESLQAELLHLAKPAESVQSLRQFSESLNGFAISYWTMEKMNKTMVEKEMRAGGAFNCTELRRAITSIVEVKEEVQRCTQVFRGEEKPRNFPPHPNGGRANQGRGTPFRFSQPSRQERQWRPMERNEPVRRMSPQPNRSFSAINKPQTPISDRGSNRLCSLCETKGHAPSRCTKYTTPGARRKRLTDQDRCSHCGERHHFMVCFGEKSREGTSRGQPNNQMKREARKSSQSHLTMSEHAHKSVPGSECSPITTNVMTSVMAKKPHAFLMTRKILVRSKNNRRVWMEVPFLFDPGSQTSYASDPLIEKLKPPKVTSEEMEVYGFGGERNGPMRFHSPVYSIQIRRTDGKWEEILLNRTERISTPFKMAEWNSEEFPLKGMDMADAMSFSREEPEILIGARHFWQFFQGKEEVSPGLFVIQTTLGPLVNGESDFGPELPNPGLSMMAIDESNQGQMPTIKEIEYFFNLESLGIKDDPNENDDQTAMSLFNKSIRREKDGREFLPKARNCASFTTPVLTPEEQTVSTAFLQIALEPEDREVTKFLWVKDVSKPLAPTNLITYRFCRVAFGVISSPFILAATLQHHLKGYNSPVANELAQSLYVDNTLLECESAEEALHKYAESKAILKEGLFNLREFVTNSPEVMKAIPEEDRLNKPKVKVLGLIWDTDKDEIVFEFPTHGLEKLATRRLVLSFLASLFDPLGLMGPCIQPLKLFFQTLWEEKKGWDDVLSEKEQTQWASFQENWKDQTLKIPRRAMLQGNPSLELHAFVDASIHTFAAAIYIRAVEGSQISVWLIFSKNRLKPKNASKALTVPRMELMAILIGIRGLKFVADQIRRPISQLHIWGDSQIALSWIASKEAQPKFIERRVKEIRTLNECAFHFVRTAENPADIATRGAKPGELKDKSLWWNGPSWLKEDHNQWPKEMEFEIKDPPENLEEGSLDNEEKVFFVNTRTEGLIESPPIDPKRFSSWTKIVQVTLFVLRFLRLKLIQRGNPHQLFESHRKEIAKVSEKGPFSAEDVLLAENLLIRMDQMKKAEDFLSYPSLKDSEGILRLKTRHTYQFALPKMPPLPDERVCRQAPFKAIGIDFLGPTETRLAGEKVKAWILLMTCLVTRAVHLEAMLDTTAESFLNVLRRFISRRGKPDLIWSDNATSFKLAQKTIEHLTTPGVDQNTQEFFALNKIKWRFIPQISPWAGGVYERLVQLCKNCFKRTLGRKVLSYDQLITFVAEVEATLNHRPITSVSEGMDEFLPLRPVDFLQPEVQIHWDTNGEEFDPSDRNLSSHQKLVALFQATKESHEFFWEMWQKEYLLLLRERGKWDHKSPRLQDKTEPKEGMIVLIHEEFTPRNQWSLGKITELNGRPGAIRSVQLELPIHGIKSKRYGTMPRKIIITRPVNKIFPLEVGFDNPTENEEKFEESSNGTPQIPNEEENSHLEAPIEKETEILQLVDQPIDQNRHGMTTRSKAKMGTVLNCLSILFAMFALVGAYPTNHCNECKLLCFNKGVKAKIPKEINKVELCCAENCYIHENVKKLTYELPKEILLNDFKCEGHFSFGMPKLH
ncbi:hypothetical protein niasHT_033955 [Heterodera trifolii]|uniref:Integrase catalytic domain-containing protein n=1 Tax=Heterodera trifolii TaxID=157864 RepID=A0ABD2IHD7_9BILA